MPAGYWVVSFASQLAIVPLIASWFRRSAGASAAQARLVAALLLAWLAAAVALSHAGVFAPRPGAPPFIGLAIAGPILAVGIALAWSGARAPESSLPSLMALQLLRVVGFVFVLAGYGGWLPARFAYPAGLGDAFIGVTAPLVALAVARRARGWRALAVAWNLAGIADLVNAVFFGVTSSPGLLRLFAGEPSTELLTRLPLSLIPTFGVPLALLGHFAALQAIRATPRR